MNATEYSRRVVSGMRPTGALHIGHLHGVLKNWIRLQHEYECFFFVADWHALTTHYADPQDIATNTWETLIDWLAAGVSPTAATLFIQSKVPEHAELNVLLGMLTPVSWLERVPTYKEQQEKLNDRDLSTFGFLGYPVLQSADILAYRAGRVPVGLDQVPHVELTREIARRFNHVYGREHGFEALAEAAIQKLGKRTAKLYVDLRRRYLEQGDDQALGTGRALVAEQQGLSLGDRERLHGFLEGGGKIILPEPQALLTQSSRFLGLDGEKMSKSYQNFIALREEPDNVSQKIRTMKTDPARVRRKDPGDPDKCPVFSLHQTYSDERTRNWVIEGCRSAGIGCLDCKKPLIDAVIEEQKPMRERARQYQENPDHLRTIVAEGCEAARTAARATLEEVRNAIGLSYR